jgi:hypothetical protein
MDVGVPDVYLLAASGLKLDMPRKEILIRRILSGKVAQILPSFLSGCFTNPVWRSSRKFASMEGLDSLAD